MSDYEKDDAHRERDRLYEALLQYGQHKFKCKNYDDHTKCDCGLYEMFEKPGCDPLAAATQRGLRMIADLDPRVVRKAVQSLEKYPDILRIMEAKEMIGKGEMCWSLIFWWINPNVDLEGKSPMDVAKAGDVKAVLQAALKDGEMGR